MMVTLDEAYNGIRMKYYDEIISRNLRIRLENEIMDWPGVSTKKCSAIPVI
jgi:hypothetical protein